ncbi:hypothetical protein JIG36_07035 [Actinoplanes sp. LDG1-06]|uniref:Uncharacterized protein n=1 Tax=Paractinoplanes ovalisporus TaxID=2810368 RepID=A0ABS2A675_9ACTN|nr:hypothetical protein [Actinoplanes ovalisporus]MBM2615316.1 hypothetical protein [Actinoplanes ovalisporus]
MEPTSNPDNARSTRGLARFWPANRETEGEAGAPDSPGMSGTLSGETEMVALGSRRTPDSTANEGAVSGPPYVGQFSGPPDIGPASAPPHVAPSSGTPYGGSAPFGPSYAGPAGPSPAFGPSQPGRPVSGMPLGRSAEPGRPSYLGQTGSDPHLGRPAGQSPMAPMPLAQPGLGRAGDPMAPSASAVPGPGGPASDSPKPTGVPRPGGAHGSGDAQSQSGPDSVHGALGSGRDADGPRGAGDPLGAGNNPLGASSNPLGTGGASLGASGAHSANDPLDTTSPPGSNRSGGAEASRGSAEPASPNSPLGSNSALDGNQARPDDVDGSRGGLTPVSGGVSPVSGGGSFSGTSPVSGSGSFSNTTPVSGGGSFGNTTPVSGAGSFGATRPVSGSAAPAGGSENGTGDGGFGLTASSHRPAGSPGTGSGTVNGHAPLGTRGLNGADAGSRTVSGGSLDGLDDPIGRNGLHSAAGAPVSGPPAESDDQVGKQDHSQGSEDGRAGTPAVESRRGNPWDRDLNGLGLGGRNNRFLFGGRSPNQARPGVNGHEHGEANGRPATPGHGEAKDENGRDDMNGRAGIPGIPTSGAGPAGPLPGPAADTDETTGRRAAPDDVDARRAAAGWASVPTSTHPIVGPTSAPPVSGPPAATGAQPTSGAPVSAAPVSPGPVFGASYGQPPAYTPALPDPEAGPVSGVPAPRGATSIPVPVAKPAPVEQASTTFGAEPRTENPAPRPESDDELTAAPRRSASLEDAEPARRGRRAAPEEPEEEPAPAEAPRRPGDVVPGHIAFWDDDAIRHFRAAWHEVKAEFVDDPETALTRAHDLLTDAVNELTEALLAERDELDPLRGNGKPDTESMRMAMRGYREFLERILAL